MGATIDGLRYNGELVVVGAASEPIQVSPFQILTTSKTVHGHPRGTARDVEETLRFAALTGIRPMTEYPTSGRGRRGLRPHDVRRRPLPHGPHHRQVGDEAGARSGRRRPAFAGCGVATALSGLTGDLNA